MPFPEADKLTAFYDNGSLSPEEKFAQEFSALGGKFVYCENEQELMEQLDALADTMRWTKIHSKDSFLLHLFEEQEIKLVQQGNDMSDIEVGISLCESLVARTGSVLVSVGGGGLIGGLASWFEQRSRVVALEPELAPTLHRARAAGAPVDVAVSGVAADSLGAKRIGDISWAVTQRHVKDALLLPDAAIRAAQLWLWQELKLAVEPAAALGLAALHTGAYVPRPDETVCLILCGANLDPASLSAAAA